MDAAGAIELSCQFALQTGDALPQQPLVARVCSPPQSAQQIASVDHSTVVNH